MALEVAPAHRVGHDWRDHDDDVAGGGGIVGGVVDLVVDIDDPREVGRRRTIGERAGGLAGIADRPIAGIDREAREGVRRIAVDGQHRADHTGHVHRRLAFEGIDGDGIGDERPDGDDHVPADRGLVVVGRRVVHVDRPGEGGVGRRIGEGPGGRVHPADRPAAGTCGEAREGVGCLAVDVLHRRGQRRHDGRMAFQVAPGDRTGYDRRDRNRHAAGGRVDAVGDLIEDVDRSDERGAGRGVVEGSGGRVHAADRPIARRNGEVGEGQGRLAVRILDRAGEARDLRGKTLEVAPDDGFGHDWRHEEPQRRAAGVAGRGVGDLIRQDHRAGERRARRRVGQCARRRIVQARAATRLVRDLEVRELVRRAARMS